MALLMRTRLFKERLLAIGVPALGLVMWFAQSNGHGLVAVYGFVAGLLAWVVWRGVATFRDRLPRGLKSPGRAARLAWADRRAR
ncbi:hypothetical protein [Streptosporangium sp. NPDC003464]